MYVVTIQLAIFNYSTLLIDYKMSCYLCLKFCIAWYNVLPALSFGRAQSFNRGSQQSFDASSATLSVDAILVGMAMNIFELATNLEQKLPAGRLK